VVVLLVATALFGATKPFCALLCSSPTLALAAALPAPNKKAFSLRKTLNLLGLWCVPPKEKSPAPLSALPFFGLPTHLLQLLHAAHPGVFRRDGSFVCSDVQNLPLSSSKNVPLQNQQPHLQPSLHRLGTLLQRRRQGRIDGWQQAAGPRHGPPTPERAAGWVGGWPKGSEVSLGHRAAFVLPLAQAPAPPLAREGSAAALKKTASFVGGQKSLQQLLAEG